MTDDDLRERLVRLEVSVEHLLPQLKSLAVQVAETADSVQKTHDLLMKAQGAKWAVGLIAIVFTFLGGTLGGKLFSALAILVGR